MAYGNQGKNFNIIVGAQNLADLYTEYGVQENSTHLSMTVPFLSDEVTFEVQCLYVSDESAV